MMILILNVSEYCVIIDDSLYHLNDDIRYSWLCLWVSMRNWVFEEYQMKSNRFDWLYYSISILKEQRRYERLAATSQLSLW